jgi:hypothetical protein
MTRSLISIADHHTMSFLSIEAAFSRADKRDKQEPKRNREE